MNAIDQTITLQPVLPAEPIVLCNSGFISTLAKVEREVAFLIVATDQDAQSASNLLQRLTSAGTTLEKARTELKAPFIAKGREIDAAAQAPAARIEAAKKLLKGRVTTWQLEEQRKAREAEEKRQAELRRLEAQVAEESRIARERAKKLADEAAELAAKSKAPVMDVDFDDGPAHEPGYGPPKTEAEKALDVVRYAPAPVASKPAGIAFRTTLLIDAIDVAKLPDVFVVRTANERAIRATYCAGWTEKDPVPECSGIKFRVFREPVSTGKSSF